MDQPLISVIVPMYNVGDLLKGSMRCILRQTYKPLEIILVDDGSTDQTWNLCQQYEKKYENVKAFHKENSGAASARNYGVKYSKGEYICFIDADDLVTKDYVSYLYQLISENKADMAICGYQKFFDKSDLKNIDTTGNVEVIGQKEALECILYRRKISSSPCFKLLRRDTIVNYPFPEGMLFEDLAVVYQWFSSIDKIAYSSAKKYFYLQHEGSSMHSVFNPKKWELITISKDILKFVEEYHPELMNAAKARMFVSAIQMLRDIPMDEEYLPHRKELGEYICKYRKIILLDKKATMTTRAIALFAYCGPKCIKSAALFYNRAIMRFKIKINY